MSISSTSIGCLFIRGRTREKRTGPSFIPDSFWERFGPDVYSVAPRVDGSYHIVSYADLGRQKRERQAKCLDWRREGCGHVERRPLYVWVFHCPGVAGFAYRGWWTYIIGRGVDGGRWLHQDEQRMGELLRLFPLIEPTFRGVADDFHHWQLLFAKRYCCRRPDGSPRKHAGRIQGKAPIWALVRGDHIKEILGRAEWPKGHLCGK